MRLVVTFEVEGDAERFIKDEWPLMLDGLYTMPWGAMIEVAPDDWMPLSIALPTEEGMVKP